MKVGWPFIAVLFLVGCGSAEPKAFKAFMQWTPATQSCSLEIGAKAYTLPLGEDGQRAIKMLMADGYNEARLSGDEHTADKCVGPSAAELQRAGIMRVAMMSEPPSSR